MLERKKPTPPSSPRLSDLPEPPEHVWVFFKGCWHRYAKDGTVRTPKEHDEPTE